MSSLPPSPAIFLDRDGTLIVEKNYLADPSGVELEAGVVEGLKKLKTLGWPLVVVSNQSGIGRGYFTHADARAVNRRVAELLALHEIRISGWYYCPHGPEDSCRCRKPLPGLIEYAVEDLNLDPARSFMIGDKDVDFGLGLAVGARAILVSTGHAKEHISKAEAAGVMVAKDFDKAADLVLSLCS